VQGYFSFWQVKAGIMQKGKATDWHQTKLNVGFDRYHILSLVTPGV
jgi:hypothetical protein